MLFKKKKKEQENKNKEHKNTSVEIHTIPDVFYGGQDPVIYKNEVSITKQGDKHAQEKISGKQPRTTPPTTKKTTIPSKKNDKKKWLIILIIVLFMVIIDNFNI